MDTLFCPIPLEIILADDIRTGAINTDSPEFDAAEKAVQDQFDAFINNQGNLYRRLLPQRSWGKLCGISVVCLVTLLS